MARTYVIRGQAPAAQTHTLIQLSSYDPNVQYQILDFRVAPAGNPSQSNCYGVLTLNQDDAKDPRDWNWGIGREIAWAQTCIFTATGIPTPASTISEQHHADVDKWFNYNIWCHTQDAYGDEAVNYMIKIYKRETSEAAGSISSLAQYLVGGPSSP